jgi:hypothetical protein
MSESEKHFISELIDECEHQCKGCHHIFHNLVDPFDVGYCDQCKNSMCRYCSKDQYKFYDTYYKNHETPDRMICDRCQKKNSSLIKN